MLLELLLATRLLLTSPLLISKPLCRHLPLLLLLLVLLLLLLTHLMLQQLNLPPMAAPLFPQALNLLLMLILGALHGLVGHLPRGADDGGVKLLPQRRLRFFNLSAHLVQLHLLALNQMLSRH